MAEYMEPEVGLKNIPDVVRARMMKANDGFPYGGLWVFTGAQGAGKTLLLMHMVRTIHEQFPKALIVTNISVFGIPCIPYTGIGDFDKYVNGADGVIFIIDEIQSLFNSLESAKMPLSQVTVWSQNRKNRRLILGTSQRYTRMAKPVREQVTWHYECRRPLLLVFYRYRVLDGAKYDESGKYILDEDEKPPKYKIYCPALASMTMYNTLEVVKRITEKEGKKCKL
ncbi:MAG: ATP-binding protein [Oscillospiraceae bacterium]|nr:ATP-binding protein [Oscillospiraceae bacterium]